MNKYPPREGDLDLNQAAARIRDMLKMPGTQVFLKWTCPACGERVTSTEPIEQLPDGRINFRKGYVHTEKDDGSPCDYLYPTDLNSRFGCVIVLNMPKATASW